MLKVDKILRILKNKFPVLIPGLFLLFSVTSSVQAVEKIAEFNTEVEIFKNGEFIVEENILYDFDDNYKHGIYRDLSNKHNDTASVWYKKRRLDLEIKTVLLNEDKVPFTTDNSSGKVRIKIGDPSQTVSGKQNYTIIYKVKGGLSYKNKDFAELYWNVTGNNWSVGMDKVRVKLKNSDGLFKKGSFCYYGTNGQNNSCQVLSANENEVIFKLNNLSPGEEVTIAQALDGNSLSISVVEEVRWYLFFVLFLIGLFGFVLYKGWRFRTANNTRRTVIAQYEPYPELLPMFTGVLIDGNLDPNDITAGLVYLAQQGFLKIKKTSRKTLFLFETYDYEVTLLKAVTTAPTFFHEMILQLLFSTGEVGETVSLFEIKKDLSKLKHNYTIVNKLRDAVKEDLLQRGFYEKTFKWNRNYIFLALLFLLLIIIFAFNNYGILGVVLVFLPTLMTFLFFLILVYRRLTVRGYKALNYIKGFREFLSVTDKERFSFHNAPEKSPQKFMEYLPYAIALKVDDKWAEVFKDVVINNPEWYTSSDSTVFSASGFSRDINSFSQSLASSEAGASGGGGSAGGGAGGGGGGSW